MTRVFCTELCKECEERIQRLDSSDSFVKRVSRAKAQKGRAGFRRKTCSICGTWIAKPHFLLHVLRGRVAEPLDPHGFEMRPCLWSNLPQECLEIILAKLPLGSRVRLTIVSKTWQSLLASSEFKRLCDSMEPPHALPVCSMKYKLGKLAPCKPRDQRPAGIRDLEVLKVGLSFLPPKFQVFHSSDYVVQEGLVCISKVEWQKLEKTEVETQPLQEGYLMAEDWDDYYRDSDEQEGHDSFNLSEGTVVGSSKEVVGTSFTCPRLKLYVPDSYLTPMVDGDEKGDGDGDEEGYSSSDDEVADMGWNNKKAVGMSFCIANPIVRTFKELPPWFGKEDGFHDHRASWKVQLEVEESGDFTVIVFSMRKNEPTVSMYRSKDNSWKATALTQPFWFPNDLILASGLSIILASGLISSDQMMSVFDTFP